ncbi:MAG: transposase family protein [Proteobacteria bacterium]|nr:transposase family protein [Pseudomonadota bacterium]
MSDRPELPRARRQARVRLAVIAPLLASPPARGELASLLRALSERLYTDADGKPVRFGFSTIESWYYKARDAADPLEALLQSVRSDVGRTTAISSTLLDALRSQYAAHRSWSYQLHHDNLVALCEESPERYGSTPSYATVRRAMKRRGWTKRKRSKTDGQRRAAERLERRETRSFEAAAVHSLWHFDFHSGRRRVVDSRGQWHTPKCLCVLDDRSRLVCHIQWYLGETAQHLVHGLMQAILKRGLPREVLHDNGAAMGADETLGGYADLSITSRPTLPYSPQQNGKQEKLWDRLEGRLMKMLEDVEPLSLELLNRATHAWVEQEYHVLDHDELGVPPIHRALAGPDVSRPAPSLDRLRRAFCVEGTRTQRRGDGTISVRGVRFELPGRLRTLDRPTIRYRRWDLSEAWVIDPRSRALLATIRPIDKLANADGRRRALEPIEDAHLPEPDAQRDPIPPLLRKQLADHAATGLPPAWLPLED